MPKLVSARLRPDARRCREDRQPSGVMSDGDPPVRAKAGTYGPAFARLTGRIDDGGRQSTAVVLADLPRLLELAGRAVNVVGRFFGLHAVVARRLLEILEDDVAGLVTLVRLTAAAVQAHLWCLLRER